ncbi:Fur family transcriptional regulator [Litorihabitans aurantiacus]|uniref:Transcriptional repressor n=1 Tax=Litorihabitans aurantiacus TaxID=1930061 RepID=A0AA37UHQ9_9MICO|nr:transcriptional repressor [Litorihabitans aurantiacus]GMA30978.1 transcriptional repressor [Litorihabitans aurantiacus]
MQRTTRQRTAVAELLDDSEQFRSAQEVHRMLADRGESVGLATVYRTLQALADVGEVDSLRGPDGEVRYRRCDQRSHHHHLVCRRCGTAVELDAAAVEEWSGRIASQHGFTDVEHTIELFGLCAACSARA